MTDLKFGTHKPIYSFTTENLDYVDNLRIRNSKVLTIGGSYDQAIYMNLLKAKEVHNIDVNIYAKYYAELKHAAIQFFHYDDFIKFFMITDLSFDPEMYRWIEDQISPEANYFFKQGYKKYGSGLNLRKSDIFNQLHDTQKIKIQNSVYLRNVNYYKNTQKTMQEANFRWKSISIEEELQTQEMYDIIVLSNIADYSHYMYQDNPTQKFKENIVLPCLKKLNPKGQIMFAYIFDSKNIFNSDKRNPINDSQLRKKLYNNIEGFYYHEYLIHSSIENAGYDCAATLEKTQ